MSVSILMVGSEALPFSKTGGLADVLGALPLALGKLGHRVTLVTPKYRGVQAQGTSRTIKVSGVGGAVAETRVIEQPLAENVKAVLVDRPELYDRDTLYGAGGDYPDNPSRFAFLCRAALEYALQSGETFDILHAHDWQAGLAPVYLRTRYASEPRLSGMTSIFTIHNLAYQGNFPPDWLGPLELGPEMMSMDALEFWGQISLLKGGIVFSDSITTVSPSLCARDSDQRVRVWVRRRARHARGRPARHPQRHRHRPLGPAARSVSARALRRAQPREERRRQARAL